MKKRILGMILAGILWTGLISGCGKSGSDTGVSFSGGSENNAGQFTSSDMSEAASADMAADDNSFVSADMDSAEAELDETSVKNTGEKIIYTYSYSAETKDFDSFYEKITAKTEQLGGYIENSEINGSMSDGMNRYAHMTLRIPADKMEPLASLLDTETNVTYRSRSSNDVTLQYVDMESHMKALRTEQETLLQLLEKAKNLKDILALQSQLTEVRYEIESYESQLRTYDNLVDYSTVYLDITEVDRTTNITSSRTSFFEEVSDRFSDNLYAVGQSLRSLAVWLISSLPVLVPLAAIAAVIIFFIRKKVKFRRRTKHIPNWNGQNEPAAKIYKQYLVNEDAQKHREQNLSDNDTQKDSEQNKQS